MLQRFISSVKKKEISASIFRRHLVGHTLFSKPLIPKHSGSIEKRISKRGNEISTSFFQSSFLIEDTPPDVYWIAIVLLIFGSGLLGEQAVAEEHPFLDDNFDIEKFKKIISAHSDTLAKQINAAKDKDVILVIGNTGAGKSTTINYLLGAKLEEKSYQNVQLCDGQPIYAKIGGTCESETLYPELMTQDGKLYYCDCPGFNDTRGEEERVANSVNIQNIINSVESIKGLVVVIDMASLTADRSTNFFDLAQTLSELLKISKGDMSDEIGKSVLFVFTKISKDLLQNKSDKQAIMSSLQRTREYAEKKTEDKRGYLEIIHEKTQDYLGTKNKKAEQENKELQLWKDIGRLLDLIHENNVMAVNVLDDGESREIITQRVKELNTIPKQVFKFSFTDPAHVRFKSTISSIATSCKPAIDSSFEIKNKLTQLKRNGYQTKKDIDYYLGMINTSEEKYKAKNPDRLKHYEDTLDRIKNEKTELNKKEKDLSDKKNEINSSELVDYWSDSINEKRSWYGFLGWTEKHFKYSGVPFSTPPRIEDKNRNKFFIEKNDPSKGVYEAYYESKTGQDGFAKITILVEKRCLPGNNVLINSLNSELENVRNKLDTLEIQEQEIKNEENKRKQNDSMINAKKKMDELKDELEQIKRERITLEKDLANLGSQLNQKDIELLKTIYNIMPNNHFDIVKEVMDRYVSLMEFEHDISARKWDQDFPYYPNHWQKPSPQETALYMSAGFILLAATAWCSRYGCPPLIEEYIPRSPR